MRSGFVRLVNLFSEILQNEVFEMRHLSLGFFYKGKKNACIIIG